MDELMEFIIPNGTNYNLVDPSEYTYWKARKNRTFYIDYELNENFDAIELCKAIIQMNVEEKDIPEDELAPIYIWIYSIGGDGWQCTALCDIIEASRIPVVTVNMGIAMSSGFLIFLAGKRRYSFKQGTFLVHSGELSVHGTAEQVDEFHKAYKRDLAQMKDYVLSHTSIDEKTFKKNQTKDWYIKSSEAEKYGICKVITSFNEIV